MRGPVQDCQWRFTCVEGRPGCLELLVECPLLLQREHLELSLQVSRRLISGLLDFSRQPFLVLRTLLDTRALLRQCIGGVCRQGWWGEQHTAR